MLEPGSTTPQEHPFLLHHGFGSRSDNYDNLEDMNFANSRGRIPAQNQANHGFYIPSNEQEPSGVCSPPLWRTSPPRSPQHHHQQRSLHYRSLSPASRAQAIARGQHELMEMVRNMPESCYELSLKDLVEQPMVLARQQQRGMLEEEDQSRDHRSEALFRGEDNSKKTRNISVGDRKASLKRSGNLDNGGFLLKMVFPVSFRSKTKKKMNKNESMGNTNSSAKVSPKPPLISEGSVKGVDKEWWRKRFSVSGESESGDSSINSGSMKSNGSRSSSSSTSRSSSG